ncbi:MAG: hypothetical protein R3E79_03610 [Caldilineaceae bacterium]
MSVLEVLNSVQYMVDEDGKRTAAVIQMNMWQSLLELLSTTNLIAKEEVTDEKTPEQIIATIQARPVRSDNVIRPKGSLLTALQNPTYADEDFTLDEWIQHWRAVEKEMKTITAQNDLEEDRI